MLQRGQGIYHYIENLVKITLLSKLKTKSVTLKIGDCVYVPAKKLHSHGSTNKKADFSHIAINSFPKNNVEPKTIWYESDFKSHVTKRLK